MKSLGAGRFPDGFRVNSDLAFGLDYRSLYATAVDKWRKGDAKKTLSPEDFPRWTYCEA